MATRNLTVRFTTKEHETVIRALKNMGEEGEKLGKKIERGGKEASKGLKAVDSASNELQNSLRGVANRAGPLGAALAATGGAAAISAREFGKAELAGAKLAAILQATDQAAGKSADEIIRYSDAMEAATLFTAEQIQDASAQMLTFKAITGDTFNQAMDLAIDLSATFGTDLKSSVLQLGKALEDPITGISALREVGVSFTAEQKLMIKELVETNQLMEAQGIILNVLDGQVGGTAAAIGNTLAGSWDNLTDSIGNFLEAVGEVLDDTVPLREFIKDTTDLIKDLTGALEDISDPSNKLRKIREEQAEVSKPFMWPGAAALDAVFGIREGELEELAKRERAVLIELAQDAENFAQTQNQNAVVSRKASTAATQDNTVALDAIIASLEEEAELLQLGKTERAIEVQLRKEIATAQKNGINLTDQEKALIREKIAQNVELDRLDKERNKSQKEKNDQLGDYIESLGTEVELTKLSAREREIEESVIKATTLAKRDDKELTEEQIALIRQRTGQIYDAAEAEKVLAKELEQSAEIYKEFARDLGSSVRDGIRGFLDGSIDDLDDFSKKFENIFYDLIANIATVALANPVIVPVVTSIGSAAGLNKGQLDQITQELGGSSGSIGLSDLSSVTDFLDLGDIGFSGGNIISGIDQIGYDLFGIGQKVAGPFTGAGAFTEGISGGFGSNLASSFNPANALAGFAGNFAADALGLSGEYSSYTSTAASLLAAGLGAGPLGIALAAFGGSALGGLFGGKPSDNTSTGVFDLGTGVVDQSVADRFTSPETQELRDATVGFSQAIATVLRDAGANFDGVTFTTEVGTRDGLKFDIGTEGIGGANDITKIFGTQDVGGFLSGIATELTNVAGTSTEALENIKTALANIDFEDQEQALKDLAFAADYDKLLETAEALDPVIEGFKAIGEAADAAGERAERLSLSLEDLAEAERRAESEYRGSFNASVFERILQIVNPDSLAERDADRQIADLLNQAESIGGNVEAVRVLERLLFEQEAANDNLVELRALQEEEIDTVGRKVSRLEDNATAFDSFLFDTTLGNLSGLDPSSRLAALGSEINRIDALDPDNAEKQTLPKLLSEFTELSAEINGFNATFGEDLIFARGVAERTKSLAESQLEIQQDILVELENQSSLLVASNDNDFDQIQEAIAAIESALTSDQLRATKIGRSIGALDDDEFAINQVLGARLDRDPELRDAFLELWNSPAFANGGIVTGGIQGRDSVMIRAMPGERVLSVPHSEMLESIYSLAVAHAVDDGRMVHLSPQSIEALADQVGAIIANSNNRVATAQNKTANAVGRLAARSRFNQL